VSLSLLTAESNISVMRILHIFSMAGVAEMLCEGDDQVLQLEQFDSMGFAEHYKATKRYEDVKKLIKDAVMIEHLFNKIIIHDFQEYKYLFPKGKITLYFHGSKLRGMDETELSQVREYPCIVSTPDLLDILPEALYLPVPVDLELFGAEQFGDDTIKEAWICMNRKHDQDIIEPIIKAKYPKAEYLPRTKDTQIDYEDMPMFLSQYTDYVDWKFTYDKPLPLTINATSCTGLQALAVGCRVWDHNGIKLSRNLLVIHDKKRIQKMFRKELE
jgi:hypothetical protein